MKTPVTVAVFGFVSMILLAACHPGFAIREAPVAVHAASAGSAHSVVIGADGALWAWGDNIGQIGDSTAITRINPVRIGFHTDWAYVSAGTFHTAAIRSDGSLWTWGQNTHGQLGDGTTSARSAPVRVGMASNWYSVSAGDRHTVAIRRDGSLWAWGSNENGQTGDGTGVFSRINPVQIGTGMGLATGWRSVSAGDRHTVAIRSDGSLWAWGANNRGQLGDHTRLNRSVPTRIGLPTWPTGWRSVSAGTSHTAAVREDGSLFVWGWNNQNQFSDNPIWDRLFPSQIGLPTGWVSVSAGGRHTVAIRAGGLLWAWGWNEFGQLGTSTQSAGVQTQPIQIVAGLAGADWYSVSAGQDYTLAVRTDGSLWAWGRNNRGQLGDGTTITRLSPERITTR